MHETTPSVFLIARPSIDLEGMRAYLLDVGGESWLAQRLQEAGEDPGHAGSGFTDKRGDTGSGRGGKVNAGELIVEFGGRACYRSWEPG